MKIGAIERPWWHVFRNGSALKRILAILIVLSLSWFAFAELQRAKSRAAVPRYITVPATYGDIVASVNETGTVNPVNEILVGTEVSGTIAKLDVDYNSIVKAGQVLAELNPTSLQAADIQARGTLAVDRAQSLAQANLAMQAEANIEAALATERQQLANAQVAQANIAKARAQLALDRQTVARDRQLLANVYVPQS